MDLYYQLRENPCILGHAILSISKSLSKYHKENQC